MTSAIPVPVSIPPDGGALVSPGGAAGDGSSSTPSDRADGFFVRLSNVLLGGSRALSPHERNQARLLAGFSLAQGCLMVVGMLITALLAPPPFNRQVPLLLGAGAVLLLTAHAFSRTRHVRLATGITIAVNCVYPISATWLGGEAQPLFRHIAWFHTSVLFAGMLASARTTVLVGALVCAFPLAASALGFGAGPSDIGEAMCFLVTASLLTFVLSRHRHEVEESRNAQLVARNAELTALQRSLEARVNARTADLEKSRDELGQILEKLQKNQQALLIAEKMASLGRLTAGIAHEMNSPLAAVRASLSELRGLIDEYDESIGDPDVTDEDHRAIVKDMGKATDLARKAAEHAAAFVRGIKSQTRDIGACDRARFDAAAVVRDALQMLDHEVTATGSHVHLQCTGEPLEIEGAPGKLAQVVTNLVTNALDASAERGGGDVHIELARHDGEVILTVRDQGPGIPDDILKKIFDPLFTTKPMGKGTGLGLTIVHDIVSGDFRGRVDVKSTPGRGAAFIVHLPSGSPETCRPR